MATRLTTVSTNAKDKLSLQDLRDLVEAAKDLPGNATVSYSTGYSDYRESWPAKITVSAPI